MSDLEKTTNELNGIYSNLMERAVRIVNIFEKLEAQVEWGWYAGHSIEHNGELVFEQFPIPVITIWDVCEIGVDLKGIYIEGRIFTSEAVEADFSFLDGYDFCVYGADEYLVDIYDSRMDDFSVLQDAIFNTGESELCINLIFKETPPLGKIAEACAALRQLGTHILPVEAKEALEQEEEH